MIKIAVKVVWLPLNSRNQRDKIVLSLRRLGTPRELVHSFEMETILLGVIVSDALEVELAIVLPLAVEVDSVGFKCAVATGH